jgi:hypothetical protein
VQTTIDSQTNEINALIGAALKIAEQEERLIEQIRAALLIGNEEEALRLTRQFCGVWTMKNVVSFIRVSTEEQATKGAGIPAQRAANEKTAQQYGLKIVKTFELSDVSGTQVLKTPEMRQLMEMMESDEIHGVVVKELSRLMRPENFDLSLLQHFVATRTLLYLPDGPHDVATDSGYLLLWG